MSKRIPCSGCGELRWPTTGRDSVLCNKCRHSYSTGCRCRDCVASHTEAMRDYRAKRKVAEGLAQKRRPGRKYLDAECLRCGEPVRGNFDKMAPYHRACRLAGARAERKRAAIRARLAKAAAGVPANPRNPFTAGTCRYCGEAFVRRNTPSPYCSVKCRRADRPDPVRPSVRRQIFERDGWTCQLCGEPVDRDADTLDDWAPTVDHVVPQSKGGGHEPSNLRCAHRWCNSVRADDTYYTAADLAA